MASHLGCLAEAPDLVKTTRCQAGRPRKHSKGWESANKQICISNGSFLRWRMIRDEHGLLNDDAVAHYLQRIITKQINVHSLALHEESLATVLMSTVIMYL